MTRRWLFADQLGPHFLDEPGQAVLLVESRAAFGRRPVHRRRAHLVLSALRHRAAELGDQAMLVQACPFTAGYWSFLTRHADRFAGNPRMARQVKGAARLDDLAQVAEQEKRRGSKPPWPMSLRPGRRAAG